jgi:hypothetical protein
MGEYGSVAYQDCSELSAPRPEDGRVSIATIVRVPYRHGSHSTPSTTRESQNENLAISPFIASFIDQTATKQTVSLRP